MSIQASSARQVPKRLCVQLLQLTTLSTSQQTWRAAIPLGVARTRRAVERVAALLLRSPAILRRHLDSFPREAARANSSLRGAALRIIGSVRVTRSFPSWVLRRGRRGRLLAGGCAPHVAQDHLRDRHP